MTDNFRELSKKTWHPTATKPTVEQINCGSLQRIADATESMAKEHNRLIKEVDQARSAWIRIAAENEQLKRQLANRKGQITKLKKKLKGMLNDSK